MDSKRLTFTFLFACVLGLSHNARILGIVPTPSYSHQVVFQPLWRELSLRGHQVTVLTTDPVCDPSLTNLTEIDLHFSYELWNRNILGLIGSQENYFKLFQSFMTTTQQLIEEQLEHPHVQDLIKNETEHFDLLMVEYLYPIMYAFSERFKCPYIGITSFDAQNCMYGVVGNPVHPVVNPDSILPFEEKLSFGERLISVAYDLFAKFYTSVVMYPVAEAIVQKHFDNNYPPLRNITKKISMLFVNADPIIHQIRPLVPVVIQIGGGTHLKPTKPIPKDLLKQLDAANQGFVYFSLGSNVKSKDLSEDVISVLLRTFADIPYLVLWKFELEQLPHNKPKNVLISKWFPQQDIFSSSSALFNIYTGFLEHPTIKLFITQGGLQSMEEAIYHHIPMLGIPFFADQANNVRRMVSKGMGLSIEHTSIEKNILKKKILELINNPKYRKTVEELADLARDQPMTGLERAVWWTEYVLRHKGAKHLRSPALDIPFYQYFLLDVILFCLLCLFVILFFLVLVVRLLKKLIKCFIGKPKFKEQ